MAEDKEKLVKAMFDQISRVIREGHNYKANTVVLVDDSTRTENVDTHVDLQELTTLKTNNKK